MPFLTAALAFACGSATEPVICSQPSTAFTDGVCLDFSDAGGLIEHRSIIEAEVGRTLDLARPLIGVSDLRIRIVDDRSGVIPEIGMGGFNPSATEVRLFGDAERPDIATVLREELMAQLAHEMHHAMRRRAVGYGSTLLEAAVSEGLADHFSLEVAPGPPPIWASSLDQEALDRWTGEVLARSTGSYNHARWFHGTDPEIPRWTGYAVGFTLVGEKLDTEAGLSPSSLVGEPASSFVPPQGQVGAR
ncbi:MAG: DUF2268 domain-containing putative Zn-dependent protease [Longimicrobiales bacterium]